MTDPSTSPPPRWPHAVVIVAVLVIQALNVRYNTVKAAWLLIPLIGFLLLALFLAHKIGRSEEVTPKMTLARFQDKQAEPLLAIYGVAFLASSVFLWLF